MSTFGWPEILIVGGVFLLFFGAKRLPELASSLGRSLRVFKKAVDSDVGSEESPSTDQSSNEKGTVSTSKK